jgi:hypothetical protein
MRLLIVIGSNTPQGDPGLVYLGRDGGAMDRAIAASTYATLYKFINPVGIRKNNSGAAANAASEERAYQAEVNEQQKIYNEAVLAKAEELAAPLRAKAEEADAKIAELTQSLAKAEKQITTLQASAKPVNPTSG